MLLPGWSWFFFWTAISYSIFSKSLEAIPKASTTTGITVTWSTVFFQLSQDPGVCLLFSFLSLLLWDLLAQQNPLDDKFIFSTPLILVRPCPVGWGCRIHWLHLCRGVRPPPQTSVLDMTLNNLMVRFQQCWSFGECGIPLHCHRSKAHSGPDW